MKLGGDRGRRMGAKRFCWWIPHEEDKEVAPTETVRETHIASRQCTLLRRAGMEHLFSVAQLKRLLKAVPECGRADAVVAVWAKVTDLEHFLREDAEFAPLMPELRARLGPANVFNPIRPTGNARI